MKTKLLILIIAFCSFLVTRLSAQYPVPTCPSNIVYLQNGTIQAYNTSLPISATNPSNTNIPAGGGGLALMPNLNAPSPNPTFYTTIGGNIAWWNGSVWVNTGHSTGNSIAVNLGGGGCYLYNLVGGSGQVYVYNGTGPATLLVTLSGFAGGGPYDICCDASGNWYILQTTAPQTMTMYSPTGAVLATYNMTGMPNTSAGGGFAIVGNNVYVSNVNGFFTGTISGSTISFTNNPGASGTMSAGDYASCPVNSSVSSFTANAVVSGTLGCATTSVNLTANTNISPVNSYSWSGPGLVGATNGSVATANAPGTYTCVISKTVCPSTSTIVTVNVTSNGTLISPTAVSSNSLTCVNVTTQLTASPGPAGYTYTWTGPGIVGPNNSYTATANVPGTYTVAVANSTNSCQGTKTVSVVSNTVPPTVTSSPATATVCAGSSTTLTASGASSYTWSTLSNAASITVSPATNTSYTVTGMNAVNGCTNSAVSTVNVVPLPTPVANNSGPICAGGTLNLNATGGSSYVWTGPNSFFSGLQSPSISNASPAATGVYTVVVSVSTCTAVATTSATVNTLPVVTATSSNSLTCANPTTQLSATPGPAGFNYSWTGPGIVGANNTSPITANQAGTYMVTVTNSTNSCQGTQTVSVVSNTTPPAVTSSPSFTSICFGQNATLTAGGAVSYTWSTSSNATSISVSPGSASSYTVIGMAANGCTSSAVSSVSVIPLPTPSAINNGPICTGGTLSFTVTGGTSYVWMGPNSFFSGSQSPSIPNAGTAATGVYTVLATVGTCTGVTTTSATVYALPTPTIQSNSPICEGQMLTLTGSGGVSGTWNGPSNFNSGSLSTSISSASPNNSGTYTLTVTDIHGCVNSTTWPVTVNLLPTPAAFGSTVCTNQPVNLSANGGSTYAWSGPAGFTSSLQNPSIPNSNTSMGGVYTVTITNVNNCSSVTSAMVIVNPLPVASASNNGPICHNQLLMLNGSGGLTYAWNGPNGFVSASQNPTIATAPVSMSGNYTLTVTDNIGCSGSVVTPVIINALPNAAISSSPNKGCAPLCVTFTATGSPGLQNTWTFGSGQSAGGLTAMNCYGTSGVYTVTANYTDANGCSGVSTYTVEAYPVPVADFNWAPIKPIINQDKVDFTDASYNGNLISWSWFFTNTPGHTSSLQNPNFYYEEPGEYPVALIVKTDQGCTDTVVKVIVVGEDFGIYVPNAFTPNGDGLNDIFQPKGFGIVKYELQIFDRWGEKIFHTNSFDEGWDGIRQKKSDVNYTVSKEDIYTWKINVTDVFGKHHEYTGHVTLIK